MISKEAALTYLEVYTGDFNWIPNPDKYPELYDNNTEQQCSVKINTKRKSKTKKFVKINGIQLHGKPLWWQRKRQFLRGDKKFRKEGKQWRTAIDKIPPPWSDSWDHISPTAAKNIQRLLEQAV